MHAAVRAADRLLVCLAMLYLACQAAVGAEAAPDPVVVYHWAGGLSQVLSEDVAIDTAGEAQVAVNVNTRGVIRQRVQLNKAEMAALEALVDVVRFFDQPEKDTRFATDVGEYTLNVSLGGRSRRLSFRYRPDLVPLTGFLGRIAYQVVVLDGLERQGQAGEARVAVSPTLSGVKVLQPRALKDPLQRFVRTSTDRNQLIAAIHALSEIGTPEEWGGFLAAELNGAPETRVALLLDALVSSYQHGVRWPHGHEGMLAVLYTNALRREFRNWQQFPVGKRRVFAGMVIALGRGGHRLAAPVLAEMLPSLYVDSEFDLNHGSTSWLRHSLPRMREEVIAPMLRYLEHSEAGVRASAAEVLGNIPAANREIGGNPMPERIQDTWLRPLRQLAVPKLEKLAANDPNAKVREAATKALQQIGQG